MNFDGEASLVGGNVGPDITWINQPAIFHNSSVGGEDGSRGHVGTGCRGGITLARTVLYHGHEVSIVQPSQFAAEPRDLVGGWSSSSRRRTGHLAVDRIGCFHQRRS